MRRHRGPRRALPRALAEPRLSTPALETLRDREGTVQLGTLGRGNHFLELQADDEDALWLMVHTGSRAMGPAIQAQHLAQAPRDASGFAVIDADSEPGRAYLADLAFALSYAAASRRTIADRVAELATDLLAASPDPSAWLECHHDAVAREEHGGEHLWVHRKGAVAAHDGATVLVPGSMGSASHHAVGRGHPDALATSAHGAGRAMTRTEARRRIGTRELLRQMADVAFDARAAPHLVEEAPSAYKDIRRVMRAQRDLVRTVRTLRPVLAYKGL